MLIIAAEGGKLRLACESCGAHAIRSSEILFWATRCQVCSAISEIHGPPAQGLEARAPAPIGVTPRREAA